MAICPDCDEDHDNPMLVAKVLKRLEFRYKAYLTLYFTSVVIGGVGAYLAFGFGGPIMTAALLASHLTYLNVRVLEHHRSSLKDATRPHKAGVTKPDAGGQYL